MTESQNKMRFTFDYIRAQFEDVLTCGYKVMTCRDCAEQSPSPEDGKILVNRVDIDFSVSKAMRLARIFDDLQVKATFFIRLHAPEYNPFSFENYRILKHIRDCGHEIGYHSEVVDESQIWEESAVECLRRDLDVLNRMLDTEIVGVASHGGLTGLNNLDFWRDHEPSEFGLLYEAYDRRPPFDIFHRSLYVSDSEWTRWKCYREGVQVEGDERSLAEHAADGAQLIYSLIHADTYYDRHFYE